MKMDSLADLESAFAEWRRSERHLREVVPAALLGRARRATAVYSEKDVVRATKLQRSCLWKERRGQDGKSTSRPRSSAAFSRLDLAAPLPTEDRPLAEFETPDGFKLRVFAGTPEALNLVSTVLEIGGRR